MKEKQEKRTGIEGEEGREKEGRGKNRGRRREEKEET